MEVLSQDLYKKGTQVRVSGCDSRFKEQDWTIESRNPKDKIQEVVIKNRAGKCLSVDAPNHHNNGAKVQIWNCNYSIQQKWTYYK